MKRALIAFVAVFLFAVSAFADSKPEQQAVDSEGQVVTTPETPAKNASRPKGVNALLDNPCMTPSGCEAWPTDPTSGGGGGGGGRPGDYEFGEPYTYCTAVGRNDGWCKGCVPNIYGKKWCDEVTEQSGACYCRQQSTDGRGIISYCSTIGDCTYVW